MKTKIVLVFVFLFVSIVSFRLAQAEVLINEIQVAGASSSDEFVELYNSGDLEVSLTDWYLTKKTSTGSESTLVAKSRMEGKIIPPGGYFLLANQDGYTGSASVDVFWPSSYGLANNNSVILYRGSDTDKDEASWGDVESSKSTQKQSDGSWKICIPSPGQANSSCEESTGSSGGDGGGDTTATGGGSSESSSSSSGSASSSSNSSASKTKTKVIENPTMKAKILASTTVFTRQSVEMQASIIGYSNENVILGKIFWNFGDGATLEQVNKFDKFFHTYEYPGEYPVFLEYYQSSFSKTPEATAKTIIKVLTTTVSISKIGDARDFFIELSNAAASDIDVSNWQIRSGGQVFILPQNSIILSKKHMTIPGKVNKLTSSEDLKLYSNTGELIYDYNNRSGTLISVGENQKEAYSRDSEENLPQEKLAGAESALRKIKTDNLLAEVGATDPVNSNRTRSNSYIFPIVFLVLLVGSVIIVYFIRSKRTGAGIPEGENFEIFDE